MELLDVYDENNNYLGYALDRKEVHEKNYGTIMHQLG